MKKFVKALDVVPDKWYLARLNGRGGWAPCKVRCTLTHGWERGYVNISFSASGNATVWVNVITANGTLTSRLIYVRRDHQNSEDFLFKDAANQETLRELDEQTALKLCEQANNKIEKLQREMQEAESLHLAMLSVLSNIRTAGPICD